MEYQIRVNHKSSQKTNRTGSSGGLFNHGGGVRNNRGWLEKG